MLLSYFDSEQIPMFGGSIKAGVMVASVIFTPVVLVLCLSDI